MESNLKALPAKAFSKNFEILEFRHTKGLSRISKYPLRYIEGFVSAIHTLSADSDQASYFSNALFEEYGQRFDIEEAFLDDQSNGWNLQKSQIRSLCALSRLWFLLAIATLYVTAQGVEVVASGKRRWVDPHWFRGNSYFPMGWDWVKAALEQGWTLIEQVLFTHNRDPYPAMASGKQYQQRAYQIEFKIHTYSFPLD